MRIRRAVGRIPAQFKAGGLRGEGLLAKLSREGLFVCTETLPEPGTPILLVFLDDRGGPVKLHGSVRWNTRQLDRARSGFGMHIEDVPDAYVRFYEAKLVG